MSRVLDASPSSRSGRRRPGARAAASILRTQIDEISRTVSRGVGLPVLKIEKSQPKVADLTTTSLEAYSYSSGAATNSAGFLFEEARRSLEQAVKLDPTFAIAYLLPVQTPMASSLT